MNQLSLLPQTPPRDSVPCDDLLCLSVRQPWAWLICNAGKDIENRDWPTRFRGRVLVHAGKTMTRADYEGCVIFIVPMRTTWRLPAYDILRAQCGGIVGETEIFDCVTESDSPWFCGEYGFALRNSKPLAFTPCKGALGFFRRHNDRTEARLTRDSQQLKAL